MCSIENCDLDEFEKGKCILHCEKNNWIHTKKNIKRTDEKKTSLFIKCLIAEFNKVLVIEKNRLSEIEKTKDFWIKEPIPFICRNLVFPDIDFGFDYNFRQLPIYFDDCDFICNVKLNRTFENKITFKNCKKIENLDFSFGKFNDKVRIKNCNIDNINFHNSVFNELADFYKSIFKKNDFYKTDFNDISVFTEVIFKESVEFKYTTFSKLSIFRNTVFEKELDLIDSIFNVKGNFLGISSNKDRYQDIKVSNRETARIIKDSFEEQNNIIEANKYYAIEMQKREDELSWSDNFLEKLVFKAHGIASNHSQEWLLALFWIINLTFITTYLSHELFCENIIKHIDRGFTFFGGLLILGVVFSKFNEFYRNIAILISTICIYLFYSNSYVNDSNLKEFSNMINPFSIMTKGEELSFGTLIYKIIIAYLIYQLIISIRQNTRRK